MVFCSILFKQIPNEFFYRTISLSEYGSPLYFFAFIQTTKVSAWCLLAGYVLLCAARHHSIAEYLFSYFQMYWQPAVIDVRVSIVLYYILYYEYAHTSYDSMLFCYIELNMYYGYYGYPDGQNIASDVSVKFNEQYIQN